MGAQREPARQAQKVPYNRFRTLVQAACQEVVQAFDRQLFLP